MIDVQVVIAKTKKDNLIGLLNLLHSKLMIPDIFDEECLLTAYT